jgi:hypothetical protein
LEYIIRKKFSLGKMVYRLIARDRTFCEGTYADCKKAFTGVSNMINAGFTTAFEISDFCIVNCEENNDSD